MYFFINHQLIQNLLLEATVSQFYQDSQVFTNYSYLLYQQNYKNWFITKMKKNYSIQTQAQPKKSKNTLKQAIQNQKIKSPYAPKYQQVMKQVSLPKPYEYYIEKLISNQIYLDHKNVSEKMRVFIIDKTPSGSVIKMRVSLGFFTLQVNIANLEHCSQLHNFQPIGYGGFGKIYFVKFRKKESAIKCLLLKRESQEWGKGWQISFLFALRQYCLYKICSALQIGPKLTKIFGFDLACMNDCIQFSMEICSKRQKTTNKMNYLQLLKVMHTFHILHKDIKPDNIMYSHSYTKQVFVDFGTSSFISEQIGFSSQCTGIFGTPRYMGPQMQKVWINYHKNSRLFQATDYSIDFYYNDLHSLSLTLLTPLEYQQEQNQAEAQKIQIKPQFTNALTYLIFCIDNSKIQEIEHYKPLLKNYSKQIQEFLCNCLYIEYYKQITWESLFSYSQYKINCEVSQQPTKILCKYLKMQNKQVLWDEQVEKQMLLKCYGNIILNFDRKKPEETSQLIEALIIEIYNQSILNSLKCAFLKNCFYKILEILDPPSQSTEQICIQAVESEFNIFYCFHCKTIKAYEKYVEEDRFIFLRQKALQLLKNYIQANRSKFEVQTLKRFELINLISTSDIDFYKGVIEQQTDPYNAIDYYFRLLAININLIQTSNSRDKRFLDKHLQKISQNHRKIILTLINIIESQFTYDLLNSTSQLLKDFRLDSFLTNKMPFTFLELTKITTKFWHSYGFFQYFNQLQKNIIQYLQDFPFTYYYSYAKIDFYYIFLSFYQINRNMSKTLFYSHQVHRIKKKIEATFFESIFKDHQEEQNQHKQCHNSIYAMKFNFTVKVETKSQNATNLRSCKSISDLKKVNFQEVELSIYMPEPGYMQQIFIQMQKNQCNFSKKKYLYKKLKLCIEFLQQYQIKISKLDTFYLFLTNFYKWAYQSPFQDKAVIQELTRLQQQYGTIFNKNLLFFLKINKLICTENLEQLVKIPWSKQALISDFLSKKIYQKIAVRLFFFGKNEQQKNVGKKILLSFVELFLENKIGSLDPLQLIFLPYVHFLEQENKCQLTFLALKNLVSSFYYTGSKVLMMNIMYFPNCYTYFMTSRSRQLLLQQIIESSFMENPQLIEFTTIYFYIACKLYGNEYQHQKSQYLKLSAQQQKLLNAVFLKFNLCYILFYGKCTHIKRAIFILRWRQTLYLSKKTFDTLEKTISSFSYAKKNYFVYAHGLNSLVILVNFIANHQNYISSFNKRYNQSSTQIRGTAIQNLKNLEKKNSRRQRQIKKLFIS